MVERLLRGIGGHPLHPPLTDATIGMFVLATALAVIGALGWIEEAAGEGGVAGARGRPDRRGADRTDRLRRLADDRVGQSQRGKGSTRIFLHPSAPMARSARRERE